MTHAAHILIVEDDEAIATGLALNLRLEGYVPRVAHDGCDAEVKIAAAQPDLILLDITMPKKDGLELLRELRLAGNQTPVIVLSARDGEYDKVAALRIGADDYVTKPFTLAELVARIDAVLRRVTGYLGAAAAITTFGTITVSFDERLVRKNRVAVKLTHLEFELLAFFLRHHGKVLGRDKLLREVWGQKSAGSRRTVDNFVGQLRAKLEDDPESPRHFLTVRGSGYRFDARDAKEKK